ncbi:MAG: M23 family metallopeptidase [Clostridiales bacterium]|nr:M23 family metallopeptidase [Clostridiales bacterium]
MQNRSPRRLPLDLPIPRVRRRSPSYRDRASRDVEDVSKSASLLRKMLAATIIIVVVLVLKNIDTEFTQNVVGYVRDGITKDMDIEGTLGKLKFVSSYLPDAVAVFGQNSEQAKDTNEVVEEFIPVFMIPAEGKVVGWFGQNNEGIDILGTRNDSIYAVADGLITDVGENLSGENYIKINHGDEIRTIYRGFFQTVVNVDDNVIKGDRIGIMESEPSGGYALHFEVWMEGKAVDPLKLIETSK